MPNISMPDLEALSPVVKGDLDAWAQKLNEITALIQSTLESVITDLNYVTGINSTWEVKAYATFNDFPLTGEPLVIYYAIDSQLSYQWDGLYIVVGTGGAEGIISVNGHTNPNVVLTKSDIGLSNVENLTPAQMPISTATQTALNLKANLASPVFTGTVTLPSTTSIGTVSNIEIGYLDGVTSSIQTQLNSKAPISSPTFTGTVVLPSTTSIGTVDSTEISYLDGVTSGIQTQLNTIKLKSIGIITIPTITKNVDGTITIGSDGAFVFNTTGTISGANISVYNVTGTTLTPTDLIKSFLYVTYNSGVPTYGLTTDNTVFYTDFTKIPVMRVSREGTTIHLSKYGETSIFSTEKQMLKDIYLNGFQRESGLMLSTTATRISNLTSGYGWFGEKRYSLGQVTSGTYGTMYEWYLVAGVWTKSVSLSLYDSTYYSDGTSRQTMTSNRYVSKYFFRDIGDDNEIYYIHGNQYTTSTGALNESVPVLPPSLENHTLYVGKIVIQQGTTVGTAYARDWGLGLTYTITNSHESLTDILQVGSGVTHGHLSDGAETIYGVKTFNSIPVLPNNSISNSQLSQASAYTIKGNYASTTGNVSDITPANLQTIVQSASLNLVTNAEKTTWSSNSALVKQYNLVSNMQTDYSNLLLGTVVETLGYSTKNDGLGRKYIITSTDVDGLGITVGSYYASIYIGTGKLYSPVLTGTPTATTGTTGVSSTQVATQANVLNNISSNKQTCKAWVNFNGTGTVAIRSSYNVSSITDNGIGTYTINYLTQMQDSNYSFSQSNGISGQASYLCLDVSNLNYSTTSLRLLSIQGAGVVADAMYCSVQIFGN
jgi:hypothetical protein